MEYNNILVTGASGFIGSHLVEELVKDEKNEKIKVLVKNKKELGSINEFSEETLKKINIVEGDLLDKGALIQALKGIKKVFHLAAIGRPMNVPKEAYFRVNVDGTRNLLEACKKNNVKRIIHVSSMSVFGYSRDRTPLSEDSPQLPVSDYGESKKQQEKLVLDFCKKNKIDLVVLRPPMVLGPRDSQNLKLFRLINTGFFPLLRSGRARYEIVYVKNFVHALILADLYGKNLGCYNVNDGRSYTIKELFETIANVERKKLFPFAPPVFLVIFFGGIMEIFSKMINIHPPFNSGTALWMTNDNTMDVKKAFRELGYSQKIGLEEGVIETANYYYGRGLL